MFIMYNFGSWTHATVWAFGGTSGDGQNPSCDLIKDSAGNLYGTTRYGGAYGDGTVFELTESGTWTETVLHSFGGSDGNVPVAGLLMDSSGAIYGTTYLGGADLSGTAFKLTQSGGVWKETVLYSFASPGGQFPSGLIKDSKGSLYGTTAGGGYGTAFKLYQSGGVWKEKTLHSFTGVTDGANPAAALRLSGTGDLYGTTYQGGGTNCSGSGCGTVFELTQSGGVWSETMLHSFSGDRLSDVRKVNRACRW
jgi:uncharacterized repeat protein (TIGR03803 family)